MEPKTETNEKKKVIQPEIPWYRDPRKVAKYAGIFFVSAALPSLLDYYVNRSTNEWWRRQMEYDRYLAQRLEDIMQRVYEGRYIRDEGVELLPGEFGEF
jgi:hypothetical protein